MVFVFLFVINFVEYFVIVLGKIVFVFLVVVSFGEMFIFFVVGNMIVDILVGLCLLMVCVFVISVLIFLIYLLIVLVSCYFK